MTSTREQIAQAAQSSVPTPRVAAPAGEAKAAPAPRTPKAKAAPGPCKCLVPDAPGTNGGCNGGTSTRSFAPGHDAKLVGYLTREVVNGNMTTEEATATLSERSGGSKLLLAKLATAIPREQAKAANILKRQEAKSKSTVTKEVVAEQIAAAKADAEARRNAEA